MRRVLAKENPATGSSGNTSVLVGNPSAGHGSEKETRLRGRIKLKLTELFFESWSPNATYQIRT
jgi:hypothetical protein